MTDDPPEVLKLKVRLWNIETYLRLTRLWDLDIDALLAELAAIQAERERLKAKEAL